MRYQIILVPEAVEDLRDLDARHRATVTETIERHLRYEPEKVSRSRIKRLRSLRKPQYRLRVDEYRVFYDVSEESVEVLAVVYKPTAEHWLQRYGEDE